MNTIKKIIKYVFFSYLIYIFIFSFLIFSFHPSKNRKNNKEPLRESLSDYRKNDRIALIESPEKPFLPD